MAQAFRQGISTYLNGDTYQGPTKLAVTDTAVATDVVHVTAQPARATDTAAATDSAHVGAQPARATDTAAATDVAHVTAQPARATDTALASDSAHVTAQPVRATDSATATDSAHVGAQPARTSDTALASDSAHVRAQPARATDTALTSDSATAVKSAAITVRGTATGVGFGASTTITLPVTTNAGNCILLFLGYDAGNPVTSGAGATWDKLVENAPASNYYSETDIGWNCSAGQTSITVTNLTGSYVVAVLGNVQSTSDPVGSLSGTPGSGSVVSLTTPSVSYSAGQLVVAGGGAYQGVVANSFNTTTWSNGGTDHLIGDNTSLANQFAVHATYVAPTTSGSTTATVSVHNTVGKYMLGTEIFTLQPAPSGNEYTATATDTALADDSAHVTAQPARTTDTALATDSAHVTAQPARATDAALASDSAHVGAQPARATDTALSTDAAHISAQPARATDAALASDAAHVTAQPSRATDAALANDFPLPYLLGNTSSAGSGLGGSAQLVVSVGTTTKQGDALVVFADVNSPAVTPTGVSDSKGNTYSQAVGIATQFGAAIFVAPDTTPLVSGTDTITVTYSTLINADTYDASAFAITGAFISSPVDQTVSASNAGSASPSATTPSLSATGELGLAFVVNGNPGGTPTFSSPFTILQSRHLGGNVQWASIAYADLSSTAAATASATITSTKWAVLVATIKTGALGLLAFSRSAADTALTTDSASRAAQSFTRSATDTALTSDTAQVTAQPARTTDTALASDSAHVTLQSARATDAALSSDSASRAAQSFTRSTTDTALASDSAHVSAQVGRATDTALSTDSAHVTAQPARSTDTALTSDSAHISVQPARTTDTALASDVAHVSVQPARTTDTALTSDSAHVVAQPARATDTALTSDSAHVTAQPARTTDAALASDAVHVTAQSARATDTALASDSAHLTAQPARATDSALSTDSAHVATQPARTADTSLTSDVAHVTAQPARAIDSALISDSVHVTAQPASSTDTVLTADTAVAQAPLLRSASDTALTSDAAHVTAQPAQTTDVALTSDAAHLVLQAAGAVDTATTSDAAHVAAQPAAASDQASTSDAAHVIAQPASATDAALSSDAAHIDLQPARTTDAATTTDVAHVSAQPAAASDQALTTDAALGNVVVTRAASDQATTDDSPVAQPLYVRSATDEALAADSLHVPAQPAAANDVALSSSTPTPYPLGSTTNKASGSVASLSLTINVGQTTRAQDTILVVGDIDSASFLVSSVTDSKGNTYDLAAGPLGSGVGGSIFIASNATPLVAGTDTITVHFTGSGTNNTFDARAFGIVGLGALDQEASATGSDASPTVTSGTTLSVRDEVGLAVVISGPGGAPSWSGPFAPVQPRSQTGSQWVSVATTGTDSTDQITAAASLTAAQSWGILLVSLTAQPISIHLVLSTRTTDTATTSDSAHITTAPSRASDQALASDAAHVTAQPAHASDVALTSDSAHVLAQTAHASDASTTTDASHVRAQPARASDASLTTDAAQRIVSLATKASDTALSTDAAHLTAQPARASDTSLSTDAAHVSAQPARATDTALTSDSAHVLAQTAHATDVARTNDETRPSFVQVNGNYWSDTNSVNALPVTLSNLPALGNTLVAAIKGSSGASVSSVSDPQGNTWTKAVSAQVANGVDNEIWYSSVAKAYSAADAVTFHMSSSANVMGAEILELSGVKRASSVDETGSATSTGTVTSLTTQLSPASTDAGDILVASVSTGDGVGPQISQGSIATLPVADSSTQFAYTAPSGWTEELPPGGVTKARFDVAWLLPSFTGTFSEAFSFTAVNAAAGTIVAFSPVPARVVAQPAHASDSSLTSDSAHLAAQPSRASDTSTTSDLAHVAIQPARASDQALASDLAHVAQQPAKATDAALASDTAHVALQPTRATDSALTSDSGHVVTQASHASDTATTSDLARLVTQPIKASDQATTSDQAVAGHQQAHAFDTSLTSDLPHVVAQSAHSTDSALVSDSAAVGVAESRAASDQSHTSDTAHLVAQPVHGIDTALTADVAVEATAKTRAASDQSHTGDTAARTVHLGASGADSASSSDLPVTLVSMTRAATEAVLLSDFAATGPVLFQRGGTDASATVDQATVGLFLHGKALDVALTSDRVSLRFPAHAHDSALTSDSATAVVAIYRVVEFSLSQPYSGWAVGTTSSSPWTVGGPSSGWSVSGPHVTFGEAVDAASDFEIQPV